MKNTEFVERLLMITELPTLYIKGGIGRPLTDANKKKAIDQYAYNKNRSSKINAASSATFGFDCCGVVKSVIWGFNGDVTKALGGAKYKSNGLNDVTEHGLFELCTYKSNDLDNIIPGELLYMKGHCGIYVGNGEVVECTPSWKDGVQITKLSDRKWLKHGRLEPYIEYPSSIYDYDGACADKPKTEPKKETKPPIASCYPNLRLGSMGVNVEYLQRDLNYLGAKLKVDGQFGSLTYKALRDFQSKHYGLVVDGIYGQHTQRVMKEVILNGN